MSTDSNDNKKYFHINDILTVTTGVTIGLDGDITDPDGNVIEYRSAVDGLVSIAEFVADVKISNPENKNEFDGALLLDVIADVKTSLESQCPWILEVEFPEEDLEESADRGQFAIDWANSIAETYGEWHEVEQDPVLSPENEADTSYDPGAPGPG